MMVNKVHYEDLRSLPWSLESGRWGVQSAYVPMILGVCWRVNRHMDGENLPTVGIFGAFAERSHTLSEAFNDLTCQS